MWEATRITRSRTARRVLPGLMGKVLGALLAGLLRSWKRALVP
ncbi:MAG: hypothetical protein JWO93_75 [Micrococcaceae bacterium]|nr:hypothetical protein [Micrococcaceae bacterium]